VNRVNRRRHRALIALVGLLLATLLILVHRAPRIDVRTDVLPAALP
jgi:hypothetical protein